MENPKTIDPNSTTAIRPVPKNIQDVVDTIREVEPLLKKVTCLFYDTRGIARFTNKFYESYLADTPPNLKAYTKPVVNTGSASKDNEVQKALDKQEQMVVTYGAFQVTVPEEVAKLKALYRTQGYAGSYKMVAKQIEELGRELYRKALTSIFSGKQPYAPRKITKKDGTKMTVGAFSNDAGSQFGHIVSNPNVDYGLLLISIAYAYTGDRLGISTCTMTTFIKEARYVGYYDEIVEMKEQDTLHSLFPPLDKGSHGMGMELA